MGTLISNTFLVAFLLILGAATFHVGMLTVLASLASLSQLASIYLMNVAKSRKIVCVVSSFVARLLILVMGITILVGGYISLLGFFSFMIMFYTFSSVSNGAFGYWMLELVPIGIRGKYFAERARIALFISSIIGLVVSMYINIEKGVSTYGILFLVAALLGLVSNFFLTKIPESIYKPQDPPSLRIFKDLFKHNDLRKHLASMYFIVFSMYVSIPFFVYYMITRLEMNIVLVFLITISGSIASALVLPKWGVLIDKYGIKSALRFSAYIVFLSFLIWPFTTLPEKYFLSIPLAFIAYLLMIIALGGFNLTMGLVAYYLGNDKRSSHRIVLNNIFTALGSVTGSLIGSVLTIPTKFLELSLTFTITFRGKLMIFLLDLRGLDFLFVISAILGFFSLSALRKYRIEISRDEEKSFLEMYISLKRYFRSLIDHLSLVPGKYRIGHRKNNLITLFFPLYRILPVEKTRQRK